MSEKKRRQTFGIAPCMREKPFLASWCCLREGILELLKEKKAEGSVELESGVEVEAKKERERKRKEENLPLFKPPHV